jgi:NAD(P)-dependent dehydrogenase (short-subunit alcohol dehydrogenase family)
MHRQTEEEMAAERLLAGKVAVITGASRGIGRVMAQMFADQGADLVLMARTSAERPSRFPGTIEQTSEECRQRGARVAMVAGDVAREEDCKRAAQVTAETFGRCDILINNAGINPMGKLEDLPLRLFQRGFEVNVVGPFMLTQALLPLLKQAQGSFIINVSSGAARTVAPGWAVYSASKAALDRMTLTLAEELAPDGITVVDLMLELSVVTEGYMFNRPDADYSEWEKPEIMGEAALWIIRHGPRYHGRIVTIADLRQDYAAG